MKNIKYEVQAKIVLLVTKQISAKSLEEAVGVSFKQEDFVTLDSECIDSSMRITGVYESDPGV